MTEFEFVKSSHSSSGGECVEVALNIPHTIAVRDSKNPAAGTIRLAPSAWQSLLPHLRS
ncbi:hypothetical protein DSC45_01595 [Streptomyces sp. YIM 130001]|uniref:DUF397 domain-containing protein n=1 Tax=Streptomyces sp. YIM 130001 TaxID=2259644 RepID=UPI000E65E56B|nr:DUF397 domain-containing protein [Streptomyces sp. YIM 130001]RII21085.1 hypothetical protein DSC45_01595 [Streptomyces sp. YIM 130001]